eukprot:333866_1
MSTKVGLVLIIFTISFAKCANLHIRNAEWSASPTFDQNTVELYGQLHSDVYLFYLRPDEVAAQATDPRKKAGAFGRLKLDDSFPDNSSLEPLNAMPVPEPALGEAMVTFKDRLLYVGR